MNTLLAVALGVTIPFSWTPGQIEVPVSVNGGAPVTFIVDTGAEYSVLSPEIAASAGVKTTRSVARDFGEASLAFGGITLPRERVMVMPFDNFKRQGRAIQGVVGYGFFERYIVSIDYDRKVLDVSEPAGFKPPDAATAIPIRFVGRLPAISVDIAVRGRAPLGATAMVDTGASQTMFIRHPFATAHRLFEATTNSTSSAPSLASGTLSLVRLAAESMTFGEWTFDDPFIRLFATAEGAAGSTETDCLIGNELLRRFRVTLDYSRKTMWLEPNAHLREPFTK